MKKILNQLLLMLFCVNSVAQFSKTHYIPPLSNSDTQEPQGQYLYISCPSTTDVKFKITKIGGLTTSGTVSRDKPYVLTIGTSFNTQLMIGATDVGKVMKNKGYIVEAEDLVYVTVRLTATPDKWQAGGLVSKGLAALGTQFRIGAFTNTEMVEISDHHYTFATILATENNTTVSFSDMKSGVSLVNKPTVGNNSFSIVLNQGESYAIAIRGPKEGEVKNYANKDGLIGAAIKSSKPIAVNCGSFAGTNGDNNLDLGFDQIVSAERTGNEYIFIKGNGNDMVEKPLIVANEDNTEVYLNGSLTPYTILNPSKGTKYVALNGSNFSANKNLYVKTSKYVFAYQGIGGTSDMANQNMHFLPPLSCETPKIINNIPFINKVGADDDFIGTVCIVTEKGADLSFLIDGNSYTLTSLPGIIVNGPKTVSGNSKFVTYTFQGLKGNVSVFSTRQVYLSYFGSSGAATYGGFYSGFTFKPEIAFGKQNSNGADCIPNIKLSINSLTAFDVFQWYLNGEKIEGATTNNYTPTQPGFYKVEGTITDCNITMFSDEIPVSSCPSDIDNDNVNDNIDIDIDNDGITNCTESLGSKGLHVDATYGTIHQGNYSNTYTKAVKEIFSGVGYVWSFPDGTFDSVIKVGKGNWIKQTLSFEKPVSLILEYPSVAVASDLLTPASEFILEVPVGNTITVLNPTNQLLIDTNYDGIYESGITEYSSFQLRFRLNGGLPLAAGTGTFKFMTRLVSSFSFTHKNLSDSENRATFKLGVSCLPKDSDNDGIVDEIDLDNDNDGIPTLVEALGKDYGAVPFNDANHDGMNDIYAPGLGKLDSDGDGVSDYLDLDSDNDGIYDLIEALHNAIDSDSNGVIDGNNFGTNGLSNALETAADSGVLNYIPKNSDTDGLPNYIDSDSDEDGCSDASEAFSDPDGDGYVGNSPVVTNSNGKVISEVNAYTSTFSNLYLFPHPIIITVQPENQTVCDNSNATFTLTADVDVYQWQLSSDGITYNDITDNSQYSGTNTATLQIAKVSPAMNGYKYKVVLHRKDNVCGLVSAEASLTVLASPQVKTVVSLVQCENDNIDGLSEFNLKHIENQISVNYESENFIYFKSEVGANTKDVNSKINNPTVYNNSNGNTVWARVENANGCFNISQINLFVASTQIPAGTVIKIKQCDDFLDEVNNDKDGIAVFDLDSATSAIIAMLPPDATYEVKYYKTQQEALQETDQQGKSFAISDVSNYRNFDNPVTETIWVRIDSNLPDSCVGLGPYILLTVDPLPNVELNRKAIICEGKDDEIQLTGNLLSGSQTDYKYEWSKNGELMPYSDEYVIKVNTDGIYSCLVTDKVTGCQNTSSNTVVYSEPAAIKDVVVVDLKDNNTITVQSSGPEYSEYSLDNPSGPFKDSNVFENVQAGIHTVYLNDKNGCGTVFKTVAVIGAPSFFTPNGDGINERWKLLGIDSDFFKNSNIEIFDRYGKLLKVISAIKEEGWDGNYNDTPLPSDDYWFVISMEDGRVVKGHFALKR